MYGKPLQILCTIIFLNGGPSAVGRRADYCTSGFMSMDRIEAVLQGGTLSSPVLAYIFPSSRQAILPHTNFTCDGSILSWTFGAQWEGNSPRYTELQIWRSSGDGSYTKVGSTTIMLEEENSTRLYQYTLTSPLSFQAGDILGYFQGSQSTSQFRLLLEDVGSDHPLHYNIHDSPSSQFTIRRNTVTFNSYHLLTGVETDSAGCDCGFMSLERMHILLGLETVGNRIAPNQRQQISPDIKFTCNGLITKWILGAGWENSQNLYPELQVWRRIEKNVYRKMNGTFVTVPERSQTRIYQYENFSPIPFQAGDILGMFLPPNANTKLRLWSEEANGPIVYYVDTGTATESPVDTIDLQHMPPLSSTSYLPLVTVEITTLAFPSKTSHFLDTSTTLPPYHTLSYLPLVTVEMASRTSHSLVASITLPPGSTGRDGSTDNVPLFVSVGVTGALLLLITAAVITIAGLVCLRKNRANKLNITDNVAYLSNTSEVKLSPNAAYTATGDHSPTSHDQKYMYATTPTSAKQQLNTASKNVPTDNNESCNIPTSTNDAYAVPTSTNPSYVTTIITSTNQAYQTTSGQSNNKTNQLNITDNVAYLSSTSEVKLSPNAAYTATGDHNPTSHDQEYMYVTTDTTSSITPNTKATDVPTVTDEASNISTFVNVAYDIPVSTNAAYGLPTCTDGITTSTNQAYQYVASDIPKSTNQTYECQNGSDALIHDYVT